MGSGGKNRVEEIGKVYGRLTVLSEAGRNNQKSIMWLCQCECGKQKVIRGSDLRRKNNGVRSCGCGAGRTKLNMTHYADLNTKDRLGYKQLINRNKTQYNLSEEEWVNLLNKQKGCCAICGASLTFITNGYAVDHNHKTDEVRGILCGTCNMALGLFKDSPKILQEARRYLLNKGCYECSIL